MKIIDYDKKGNVIRFYLGENKGEWGEDDYWGDDWSDRPYEHNAGRVYDEFIKGWIDVAYTFDYYVAEPSDDWAYGGNSPFSKEDMKKRKVPCIVATELSEDDWDTSFIKIVGEDSNFIDKFYFNDPVEKIEQCKNLTVLERWDK